MKEAGKAGLRAGMMLLIILVISSTVTDAQELLLYYDFENKVSPEYIHPDISQASEVSISQWDIEYTDGADPGGTTCGYAWPWPMGPFNPEGKHLEFSFTPAGGLQARLSDFSLWLGRSTTGPRRVTIHVSADGFSKSSIPLLENVLITSTGTVSLSPFSTGEIPEFDENTCLSFRIWGHSASGTGTLRFNDFKIFGQLTSAGGCDPAGLSFRSCQSGPWDDPSTWMVVEKGGQLKDNNCIPDHTSARIEILDTVSIRDGVSADEIVIRGVLEISDEAELLLMDGQGDDIIVESGGMILFSGGDMPSYENQQARLRVKSGAEIRVDSERASLSDKLAGNQSYERVIYEDGSVFHWNSTEGFSTSGQVYFPDAEHGIVPIFRISRMLALGEAASTTINGRLEARADIIWKNSGEKIFRNGFTGPGNISQYANAEEKCGQFIIDGRNAEIGGDGKIYLNNNGLKIAADSTLLTSDKCFEEGPLFFEGVFDAAANEIEVSGDIRFNENAFFCAEESTLILNGSECQNIIPGEGLLLNNLIVENPAGIIISGRITISGTLSMKGGNISCDTLEIGTDPDNKGELIYLSGSVTAAVKRWFNPEASMPGTGFFPVGTENSFNSLNIIFTEPPTAGSITTGFITDIPDDFYGNLPFIHDDIIFNTISDFGYWKTTADDGLTAGSYTLELNASGIEGISNPDNIRIIRRNHGETEWHIEGEFIPQMSENHFSHRNMLLLGEFALAGNNDENPLPVQLLTFEAIRADNMVLVSWSTASELMNDYFTLERSIDTVNLVVAAIIPGAGTCSEVNHYSYIDESAPEGILYYRLKQTDYNGASAYSHWIAADGQGPSDHFRVSVKQYNGTSWLEICSNSSRPYKIELFDLYGQQFYDKAVAEDENKPIIIYAPYHGNKLIIYRISDSTKSHSGKIFF